MEFATRFFTGVGHEPPIFSDEPSATFASRVFHLHMHRFHRCVFALLTLLSFGTSACIATVPPPPAPSQVDVPEGTALLPPAPGKGRVLLQATNGPARVDEILAHESGVVYGRHGTYTTEGDLTKPLCPSTPCAANFDFGQHDVLFTSLADDSTTGDATMQVASNDSALVGTMGHNDNGGVGYVLGATSLVMGGVVLLGGTTATIVGAAGHVGDSGPGPSMLDVGEVMLGVGVGLAAVGLLVVALAHPKYQNGSASQLPLAN